jgi:hypothetical protein
MRRDCGLRREFAMNDRDALVETVETHCRTLTAQDKDGWLRIWADDAVLEDPVGVDTFRGIELLSTTFWALVELTRPLRIAPREDVIVCGNEAIAILSAESSWGGKKRETSAHWSIISPSLPMARSPRCARTGTLQPTAIAPNWRPRLPSVSE